MQQVNTQISDANYAKIKESGMSAYQFVQDAVAEKISRIEREQELEIFKKEIAENLEVFEKRIEEKIVNESLKMRKEFISNTSGINLPVEEAMRKYVGISNDFNRNLANIQKHLEELLKTRKL
jgi:hypothetical protein